MMFSAVRYDIRRLCLKGGQGLWAVWIGYDHSSDVGLVSPNVQVTQENGEVSFLERQSSQESNCDDDGLTIPAVRTLCHLLNGIFEFHARFRVPSENHLTEVAHENANFLSSFVT